MTWYTVAYEDLPEAPVTRVGDLTVPWLDTLLRYASRRGVKGEVEARTDMKTFTAIIERDRDTGYYGGYVLEFIGTQQIVVA